MKNAYEVIKRPLVTEKVVANQSEANTVAFEVDPRANKLEIKAAVEELWKVKVEGVRTLVVRGKTKRYGQHLGKRKNWKKAYVSLKAGDKIEYWAEVKDPEFLNSIKLHNRCAQAQHSQCNTKGEAQ